MRQYLLAGLAVLAACLISPDRSSAQDAAIQPILQDHQALIVKSSRKTIAPVIEAVASSGLPQAQTVLEVWAAKNMWQRKEDGLFFIGERIDSKTYALIDFDSGEAVGEFVKKDLKQIKPNSGIRALIGTALVQFQLSDPNTEARRAALLSIERDPEASLLAPLRASIEGEPNAELKAQKQRLERLLTIGYDTNEAARLTAISDMSGDLGVDVRATLNP
ncbi:MAG: urea ABC transporter permease subunit UrtB, partial [Shimia sp.]|nr:urea ABC transporter permease subunit UrtB [Shimia sp.]